MQNKQDSEMRTLEKDIRLTLNRLGSPTPFSKRFLVAEGSRLLHPIKILAMCFIIIEIYLSKLIQVQVFSIRKALVFPVFPVFPELLWNPTLRLDMIQHMKQENKETKQESPIIRDIVLAEVHPDLPEEDIDELVRNFDASNHEPPVTIGHTVKDSDPAYGWIKKVWKRGRQLWGTVEFIRDMADLIKRGLFKNRSISYYTNYEGTGKKVLRHLAILGAAPPRIKGMPAIQFKEKKAFKLVNFVAEEEEEAGTDDSVFTSIATNFRAMVDWLNGIMETQQAQLVMENFCLLDFQYAIESAKEQAEFLEIINNKIKELDMGDEKATLFAMENLKEEIKNLREEKAKVQVENHVDTLIKEGKLKPADKENLIKTYCELGDEQRNALMELDKNRTKVIEFGELEGASGEGKRRNKETEAIKKHFPNLTDEEIKTYGG